MTIVIEIARAIQRNPKINRVLVTHREYEKIRAELEDMTFVKQAPRPTYRGPFGNIDRFLWDELNAMMKRAPIEIMGRPVIGSLGQ